MLTGESEVNNFKNIELIKFKDVETISKYLFKGKQLLSDFLQMINSIREFSSDFFPSLLL